MPYTITQFQPTPNPHALKCLLDHPVPLPSRSYRSRTEAPTRNEDPLAAALFDLPGVVGLLIQQNWITVSKSPEADWSTLRPLARKALLDLP